jgi:hypothetical protein
MNQPDQVGREIILAAAAYIGLLVLALMPQTHSFAVWLLPIPLMVLIVQNIRWAPIAMAVLAAALLVVMGYGWFAGFYGLAIYFMGWAMGESLQSGRSPYYALVLGTLTVVMLELVRLAMYRWAGMDLYAQLQSALTEAMQRNPSATREIIRTIVPAAVDRIRLLTPGLLCAIGFLLAVLNLLGARLILGPAKFAQGLLSRYQLPRSVIFVYAVALTAVLFQLGADSPFWWQVWNNAAFLGGFFIGIQGLAFLWRRIQLHRARYAMLAGLVALSPLPVVRSIYILLGLLDVMNRVRSAR